MNSDFEGNVVAVDYILIKANFFDLKAGLLAGQTNNMVKLL